MTIEQTIALWTYLAACKVKVSQSVLLRWFVPSWYGSFRVTIDP